MNTLWKHSPFLSLASVRPEQKYRGGLVMIDVLSKYAVVVPIDGRTPFAIIEATKEVLRKWARKAKSYMQMMNEV